MQAKRLLNLVSLVDDPEALPPSKEYSFYSNEVTKVMSELSTEIEARQFVIDIYMLAQMTSVPPVVVFYPALREYVRHHRRTPELLVTLFTHSSVVGETNGADQWLREAHGIDPDNKYVLWQRLLARGNAWFPEQLIHSTNLLEEENWLLNKLLKRNPYDPLAIGVQAYLKKTQGSLKATGNLQLLNSLQRLAPDPMRHIGLLDMLRPLKISHRTSSLSNS